MTNRIAILGDFNPVYQTHHALNDSIRQSVRQFDQDIQFDWIDTNTFNFKTAFDKLYSGLWIAPGSPYKNAQNVIDAIAYTRQNDIPTFGNCGGFQHMIIEFARNVCGVSAADHEETNPDAKDLVITKLSCSLIEKEEELSIVDTSSILYKIIEKDKLVGKYYCSYGVNEKYVENLKVNGLKLTAFSLDQQVRAFELKTHPFFLGTLFQPALTSSKDFPNPIIIEFIRKCLQRVHQ